MAASIAANRPYKIASWPEGNREGDIPYGAIWSDGSMYLVYEFGDYFERVMSGPMFGGPLKTDLVYTKAFPRAADAAQGQENVAMRPLRQCPHGVNVGPLDDYGVAEGERVFSTYCAECSHDQMGRYPWDNEAAAYEWPEGYHPRTLEDDDGGE